MNKICIDARLLGPTGIGTYLANLLSRLFEEQYQWIVLTKPEAKKAYPFLEKAQVIETTTPIFSKKELLFFHKEIPVCDLFWAPHINACYRRPLAKRILLTLCDTYHLTYYNRLSFQEKVYVQLVLKRAVKRADQIVTISSFSKEEIIRHFPYISHVQVIHCGVDHQTFTKKKTPPCEKKFFLAVGSLKWHKNLQGLLEGFEKTIHLHDIDLVICGSSQDLINSISLQKLLSKSPQLHTRVRCVENLSLSELGRLYQEAHGFIFPSFYEGFGLPPLEAMASGCPVLAAKAASLPEVCGNAAHYINPYSSGSIAEGLIKLIYDEKLRATLQQEGLKQAQKFSWEDAVQKHLALIEKLLK